MWRGNISCYEKQGSINVNIAFKIIKLVIKKEQKSLVEVELVKTRENCCRNLTTDKYF